MFYYCWASAGQSNLQSGWCQLWLSPDLDRIWFHNRSFIFFNYYWTCRAPYLFVSSCYQPSFPYLWHRTSHDLRDTWIYCITQSPAAFVVPLPWSLSPEHKSNSDAAELRTLSSLMGSQIISSGIFYLLTLTIPLEILSFRPQYNFWTNPVIGRRAGKRRDYCWPHVWAHVYTWCSTRTDNFCALVWVRGLCFHPSCNEISCEVSLMRSFKCGITPATL